MIDMENLANALFGGKRAEEQEVSTDGTTRTYMGVAVSDSVDGMVRVDLGGDVTLPDDLYDEDGNLVAEWDGEGIEIPTSPQVFAGQDVLVTLVGGGALKTPMVTACAGAGDSQDSSITEAADMAQDAWDYADEAKSAADAAQESAETAATAAASAQDSADDAYAAAQQAIGDAAAASTAASSAQSSAESAASAAQTANENAQQAIEDAAAASDAAAAAQGSANQAQISANAAQASATSANNSANAALTQLSIVEDVSGTLSWIRDHGTYRATTDTTVHEGTVYFELVSGDYVPISSPDPSANPSASGWYVLDVTDSQTDYIMAHLAVTSAGLWVLPSGIGQAADAQHAAGYKALLAANGMTIYDGSGTAVVTYGQSTTFATDRDWMVGNQNAFVFYDASENTLQIGGANVTIGGKAPADLLTSLDVSATQTATGADITINGTTVSLTNGAAGEDGAQILGVTTAPTSYTTTVGGFAPKYRIALSTVLTQSGASEVRIGDILSYSYYHYPVGYVDASYVYCGTRKNLRGAAGASVSVTSIEYGTSSDEGTEPSSWSTTAPTLLAKGTWLWVRTSYSDSTSATTKSYVGTDGEDGTSVFVQSATKSGDTTTVVIADSEGHTSTLTIKDGTDGTNGTNGQNGLTGYVHTAWANSADGSTDFSTTVSANKKYLGVYTDNTEADSTSYSKYSWSLIKGADGTSVTVSKVEYGTSASASTQPGSWSETVPTSVTKGHWLWVRTTYSDSTTAITKSYVGTDGTDGKSVYVQSSSKSGDTTTVVLTDGTTSTTLTIKDGEDGQNGTAGASGYVHTAWANSADGRTDFSTTASAGKSYLGVYTDNTAADSQTYSDYSWSLIKGADGHSPTVTTTKNSDGSVTIYIDGTATSTVDAGEDGQTPTITTTKNSDGSVTIYVNGTASNTVEAGADGTSYYTYVRYSANANGSGMVTTPTSATKYIGVYTGTSSSVPAYTSFKWSKYVGDDGNDADPLTVTSHSVDYQLSTSGTTAPTGTWSTTPLAPTTTQYLWTRTTLTFSDGTTATSYSVGGKAGTNGQNGTNGTNGTDGGRWYAGTGITGTSTTATTFSGSGVSSAVVGDMYLNTSTYNTYRCTVAGAPSVAKWVYTANIKGQTGPQGPQGPQGETGGTGAQGVSVTGVEHQYYLSTSSSLQTGGSWTVTPATYVSGRYYWERWKITFSNSTTTYTTATLAEEVTSAWTAIESSNEQIALKANATDVYTKTAVDGLISQEVTDRNSAITAKANEINLSVTEKVYQGAQPNLSPYFSSTPYNNTNTYWKSIQTGNGYTFTDMGDGWMRVQCTNSGSSVIRRDWYPVVCPSVLAGQPYTWLVEIRNNASSSISSGSDLYLVQSTNAQFWGQKAIKTLNDAQTGIASGTSVSVNLGVLAESGVMRKVQNAETASDGHWTDSNPANVTGLACWTFRCGAGATIDYEARISVYEGEYVGPYKPYSGTQLYASQAELKVTNDSISTKVDKDGVISSINQTSESVTIDASKINLVGAVTIGDLASATQDAVLNSNVQVGGRNLALDSKLVSHNAVASAPYAGMYSTAPKVERSDGFVAIAPKQGGNWTGLVVYMDSLGLAVGDLVAFSCLYEYQGCNADLHFYAMSLDSSGTRIYPRFDLRGSNGYSGNYHNVTQLATISSSNPSGKVWVVAEWSQDAQDAIDAGGHVRFTFQVSGTTEVTSGGSVHLYATKLERGNKPTDWSPAPEDVDSSIESISVGGRNLLRGTSTMTAGDGRWDTSHTFRASGGALSNVTTSGLPIRGVSGALRVTNTGSSAARIGFAQDRVEGLLTGETYTQGAWVRASTTVDVYHQPIYKDSDRYIRGATVSIGTDWTYISFTGTLTGTQATDFYSAGYMYANEVPANGWFEVCGIKLEKGNKATDWTPALEDVADDISSAEANAKEYADAIEVGGRNLLPGTQDWSGANKQSNGTFTVTSDKYAGCSVITQVWTSSNSDLGYQGNVWTQPLEADTWYTLSFWAKASSSIRPASYLYSSNVVDDGINSSGQVITATDGYVLNSITTDWQRIWVSWHIRADATAFPQNLIITRLTSTHSGVTVYVAGAKLEKGNKPTDWTPAPEDVDADISEVAINVEAASESAGDAMTQALAASGDAATALEAAEEAQSRADLAYSSADEIAASLSQLDESIQQWATFTSETGLTLGANDSDFDLNITNTRAAFRYQGTVTAYSSGTEYVAPRMTSDEFHVGGFMWTTHGSNGGMALKWVGLE